MAKKKRKAPSINSSSSADLAFTLLIFFLVVTSMDTDEGLARLLPRWVPEDQIHTTDEFIVGSLTFLQSYCLPRRIIQ